MAQEFEGQDLGEAVFWGVSLREARFRDVDFTGTRMFNVWLRDVEIDGLVDRLVINGVDVTEHIHAHDPWMPLRGMLRPTDRAGLLAAWDELDREWTVTIERARALPDAQRHASVGGEWSFVQTLRHLVFGADKWFTLPLDDGGFHPIGLPNSGSAEFPWPGIDRDAAPSFEEAVTARAEQVARVRAYLEGFTAAEVDREVEVLENGRATAIECMYTVFEEAFEHLRYARRDLAALG